MFYNGIKKQKIKFSEKKIIPLIYHGLKNAKSGFNLHFTFFSGIFFAIFGNFPKKYFQISQKS